MGPIHREDAQKPSKTVFKSGKAIWTALNDNLQDDFWTTYAILGEAHHLSGQATVAFVAQLFDATVLLCRTTLESAFFPYLTRKWDEEGVISLNLPKTLDGENRSPEYDELSRGIRKEVKFTESQIQAIAQIATFSLDYLIDSPTRITRGTSNRGCHLGTS